jgi:hypothetical protein
LISYEINLICDKGECLVPGTNGIHERKNICHGFLVSEPTIDIVVDRHRLIARARKFGWLVEGRKAFCPECRKGRQ